MLYLLHLFLLFCLVYFFHLCTFIKTSFNKVRPTSFLFYSSHLLPLYLTLSDMHFLGTLSEWPRTPSYKVYHLLSMSASLAFSSSSFFLRLAASALSASTVSWLPSILSASVAIFPNTCVYTRKCTLFLCGRGRIAWIWTVCRTNQEICKKIGIALP